MRSIRASLAIVIALAAGVPSPAVGAADAVWVPKDQRTPAPKLTFSDIPGARRQFSYFKGKVLVVNFWATWCAPCRAEMPELVKAYGEYRGRGVEFVGAANEPRSAKAKVREFMQGMEIAFPVWLEASEEHLKALGVGPGLPATVIVDAQGRVAARIVGVTDAAQLRELLDRILSEQAASDPAGGR
jgi:thiol-disulfide isomerase/thioredoxin